MDEAAVKVAKSQERLDFLDFCGGWPVCNTFHFRRVHSDVSLRDEDSEIFDGGLIKGALLWFEVQIVLGKALEDFVREGVEFVQSKVKEKYIIEVDDEVSAINQVTKNSVHEGLKGCRGITKAKGHNKGFKESKGAFKSSFPFVAGLDTDVVVSPSDVKFCKISGALEFIDEVGDQREGCFILDGDIVEGAIVLDRA